MAIQTFYNPVVGRAMKGLKGSGIFEFLKLTVWMVLFLAINASGSSVFMHLRGVWSCDLANSPQTNSIEQSPFEAITDGKIFYFVVHKASTSIADQLKFDYVATYDGTDHFWVCYKFPLEDGNKQIVGVNPKEAAGFGRVGPGSFPENVGPPMEALWLALFWPYNTNALPSPEDLFASWRVQPVSTTVQNTHLSVQTVSQSGDNFWSARFYTSQLKPLYSNASNLVAVVNYFQPTNLNGQTIPLLFTVQCQLPYEKIILSKQSFTNNPANVCYELEYRFRVESCLFTSEPPPRFPPAFKDKPLLIYDSRIGENGVNYIVGGASKISHVFASRGDPQYATLADFRSVRGKLSEIRTPKKTINHYVLVIIMIAAMLWLPLCLAWKHLRRG